MARRATRNAQQTIYRLYFGPLERNVRGRHRKFDSEGGNDASQILFWLDNVNFRRDAQRAMSQQTIYFQVVILWAFGTQCKGTTI